MNEQDLQKRVAELEAKNEQLEKLNKELSDKLESVEGKLKDDEMEKEFAEIRRKRIRQLESALKAVQNTAAAVL